MPTLPRVLTVETGFAPPPAGRSRHCVYAHTLDYGLYARTPHWWRRLEALLKVDLLLALEARRLAPRYDLVWAGSEKAALPLALMGTARPLIAMMHYPAAPLRQPLLRALIAAHKFAGLGYVTEADRRFITSRLGAPPARLIQAFGARLHRFSPGNLPAEGPILSLGVTRRDYRTYLDALRALPGCQAEIYISSRYQDVFRQKRVGQAPAWVQFKSGLSEDELLARYRQTRFVAIPLVASQHFSAGASVALEAAACGKAIIATHTPGMESFVVHGRTGLLVAPGASDGWRAALQELWNDPGLAQQMGAAGRRHVETHYDPAVINEGIEKFLFDLHNHAPDAAGVAG